MSQRVFKVGPTTACMVGWDQMLETFFGQVYEIDVEGERADDENGEPNTILWVGTSQDEIRTVDELERLLKPLVVLPDSVRAELYEIEVD